MDTKDIIIIVSLFGFLGFLGYLAYVRSLPVTTTASMQLSQPAMVYIPKSLRE